MPRIKRKPMSIHLVPVPREQAEQNLSDAIGLLADVLVDQILAEARAEVAASLGRNPADLDHETDRMQRDQLMAMSGAR
jgi:hypothetical protein